MPVQFPYKRICVIGTSASGKSTLSRRLAAKLQYDYIELDSLYHGPNWSPADWEIFRERASVRLRNECWVCDGNYISRAEQLQTADCVIWLNYPFRIVFGRVLKRTLKRLITKEELWNGNRESWRMAFSKESIVLWVLQTYWKRRKDIPPLLALLNATSITFTHPKEAEAWLNSIG